MSKTALSFSILTILLSVTQGADSLGSPRLDDHANLERTFPQVASIDPARGAGPSPLIEAIRQSSRQAKVGESLRYVDQAKELISKGAEVDVRDQEGRTPMHWTVIGAMYAEKQNHKQAYVELAELLVFQGADVNVEDVYGNTPLDWQEVSPTEEMGQILIENDARTGFSQDESVRNSRLLERLYAAEEAGDLERLRSLLAADIPPGTDIQIRLTTTVASNSSWAGDPVEAVVTAPVVRANRIVVNAGSKMQGSVLYAARATNKFEQAELAVDFANLVDSDGTKTRLATRLIEVDNARETVQAGRIVGISFPHSTLTKISWGLRLVGRANPVLGAVLEAATFGFGKTYKREIVYEPGVEMRIRVTIPEKLSRIPPALPWPAIIPSADLVQLVNAQPVRVETAHNIPSDITNVMFLGPREKIEAAFEAAGWSEATKLGVKSGLRTFAAIAQNKGYHEAPFSLLLLDGQKPDLTYQKQNNSFAKRHHIRIFNRSTTYRGQEVWVGACTHDIGIGVERGGTRWIHKIDTHIDREREKVLTDFMFSGMAKGYVLVDRPDAPKKSQNATGDNLETDGRMLILALE